jgi:glycerol uptake facilitator-like aquaporin
MLKFSAELIGSLFLTLAIGLSGNPVAAGLILAALIYLFSDISGSHFNPAISLAAWVSGKISLDQLLFYLAAQLIGAFFGAFLVWQISGITHVVNSSPSTGTYEFVVVEFLFSFLFVLIFLFMVYPAKKQRNPVFGLMIGLTFYGCYIIAEPISGTGLNPSLTSAFVLVDTFNNGISYFYLPIYILAPLLGGLAASYVYKKMG